jgi:hypothetical protein
MNNYQMPKARSTAKLKNLPETQQAEIYSKLSETREDWSDTSLDAVRIWLAGKGIKVSKQTISEFFLHYQNKKRFDGFEASVKAALAEIKKMNPKVTPEQLEQYGQYFFTVLAVNKEDSMMWKRAQDVAFRRDALNLARDKFEFNASSAALAQAGELKPITRSGQLNDCEKLELARKLLFGEATPAPTEATHEINK